MTIIGIIGRIGSGKTEAVEYLHRRYGMPVIVLGDIVRELAAQEGLAPTRANLHHISKRYADRCGADFFARRALARAAEIPDNAFAITGIRTPADVVAFRKLLGEDFVLVHVETLNDAVRFERLRQRGLPRDPETYDDFLRMNGEEERRFRIDEALRSADRKVRNDGSLADLYEQIELVVVQGLLARVPA